MEKRKAYLEKWIFEYKDERWEAWYVRDSHGNCIIDFTSKEKCEEFCKLNGYEIETK